VTRNDKLLKLCDLLPYRGLQAEAT